MRLTFVYLTLALAAASPVCAQANFSGSDGSDGPLEFPDVPAQDAWMGMAYDAARQKTVIFGGLRLDNLSDGFHGPPCDQTWSWDGSRWELLRPAVSPSQRSGCAMVYDSQRQKIVLFGGHSCLNNGRLYNDTWEWDGTTWAKVTTANAPPARAYHAMCYDSTRNVTLLFGGTSAGGGVDGVRAGALNDTWIYDGTDWTQLSPASSPSVRLMTAMAFDSARGQAVLYGGLDNQVLGLSDTWEWDGSDWIERTPATKDVGGAFGHAMAYDSARGQAYLFGQRTGVPTPPDPGDSIFRGVPGRWEWDGSDWTEHGVIFGGGAGGLGWSMSYDSSRQRLVVWGGFTALSAPLAGEGKDWTLELSGGTVLERPRDGQEAGEIDLSGRPTGVFQFSKVSVGRNRIVTFRRNASNTPLRWFVSGDVSIKGWLIMVSQEAPPTFPTFGPQPFGSELPGHIGGFSGGAANDDSSGGQGPGGGAPANLMEAPSGNNLFMGDFPEPIIGGSGGGGARVNVSGSIDYLAGGAGGGALYITSGTTLTLSRTANISVTPNRGTSIGDSSGNVVPGGLASAGSFGAVRLSAPKLNIFCNLLGRLDAVNGFPATPPSEQARFLFESNHLTVTGTIDPEPLTRPMRQPELQSAPTIRIVSVDGAAVPAEPGGSLADSEEDVEITAAAPVTVSLQTTNIPQGTVLKVRMTQQGPTVIVDSTPVDASGLATATLPVPSSSKVTIQSYVAVTMP